MPRQAMRQLIVKMMHASPWRSSWGSPLWEVSSIAPSRLEGDAPDGN